MKLAIETRHAAQREVELVLRGEIDYATAQQLRAAITAALHGSVDILVVDLAEVTFVDSTGVGTLVVARRICTDVGVTLHLRNANAFVARLFGVVGVAGLLGVDAAAARGEVQRVDAVPRIPRPQQATTRKPANRARVGLH